MENVRSDDAMIQKQPIGVAFCSLSAFHGTCMMVDNYLIYIKHSNIN